MTTIKLYDQDAYQREFMAQVLSCEAWESKEGEKCYGVILDRTCFFPEQGGQTPDRGTINGVPVADVQIQKDQKIVHCLESPMEVGTIVQGNIDWQHRFSNMQQHTAEHIFSGLAYKRFGYHNVGFHLSDQIVTMDFDGTFTKEQIEEMEWTVNEAIVANVPVHTGYPTLEELQKMEYRSKLDLEGDVRIVEIQGYDVCACCAPHVARTGEIGVFKIQFVQSYKGGVRISFLSGFRALEEYRNKARIIGELSGILTTNQELLAEHVTKQKNHIQTLKNQLNLANQELMKQKIEKIPSGQKDVLLFEPELDTLIMRNTVNLLMERHGGVCGVFVGTDTDGYNFIIGSKNVDCREVASKLRNILGAKGGGSALMVQGTVNATEEKILKLTE